MDTVIGGAGDADVFARAARSGFAGVEVVWRRGERDRVESLLRARDATGLAIPSLVLGEHNDGGLGDPDARLRDRAREDVVQAIEAAAVLGADVILVPFFLRGELVGEAHVDRAGRALRELCPAAAERGVSLCYEGTLPAAGLRRLATLVDSPAFGCYFDLANPLRRALDTATELRALADLVRRVHLKDTRVPGVECPPGRGLVDFGESVRAVEEIGYDGWLVLETPAAPEEVVRRDLSFARSVFPALELELPWPRLGAFSYGFDDWDRLGSTFRSLGLEVVQLGTELLDEGLADPGRIAALDGVSVAGLAGYRNLVARDAATRRDNLEFLCRCLELAPALGTSIVATGTGTRSAQGDWSDDPENWSPAAWELLADAIGTLLPVAERSGTILAVEAHARSVLRTQGQLIALLERFPSPHLQVVCDPYGFLSPELLPVRERVTRDLLERFEHRFVLAHLDELAQRPYLDFLRDRRPDLPLILEHLPLGRLPRAIERVRAMRV